MLVSLSKYKGYIILGLVVFGLLGLNLAQRKRIKKQKSEIELQTRNRDALLKDVENYKTKDGLNVARIDALELSVKDFEKFRAEDAKLIAELRQKRRELEQVTSVQSQTIRELQIANRDTVLVQVTERDTVEVPAKAFTFEDKWITVKGAQTADSTYLDISNREELLASLSVKYKRFLGFLWKTGIKDRKLDVVSKNPYTTIEDVELVLIR